MISGGSGRGGYDPLVAMVREQGPIEDRLVRQRLADIYARERILKYLGFRFQTAVATGDFSGAPDGSVMKLLKAELVTRIGDFATDVLGPGRCTGGRRRVRERLLAAPVPEPVRHPDRRRHQRGAPQQPGPACPGPAERTLQRPHRPLPRPPQGVTSTRSGSGTALARFVPYRSSQRVRHGRCRARQQGQRRYSAGIECGVPQTRRWRPRGRSGGPVPRAWHDALDGQDQCEIPDDGSWPRPVRARPCPRRPRQPWPRRRQCHRGRRWSRIRPLPGPVVPSRRRSGSSDASPPSQVEHHRAMQPTRRCRWPR